jgi:hypothetical protein
VLLIATHEGEGEFAASDPRIKGTRYADGELRQALTGESFLVDAVRRRDPLPHEMQSGRVYVTATAGARRLG